MNKRKRIRLPQENLPQVLLSDTFPILKKPQTNGSPLLCEKQAFKIDFSLFFILSLQIPLKAGKNTPLGKRCVLL